MKIFRNVFLLLATLVLVGTASAYQCWNSYEIMRDAHDLDESARRLSIVLYRTTGYSHVSRDAENLSRAANHLHRVVENRADCYHIQQDFRQVEYALSYLDRSLRRAHDVHHNRWVQDSYNRVIYDFNRTRSDVFRSGGGRYPGHGGGRDPGHGGGRDPGHGGGRDPGHGGGRDPGHGGGRDPGHGGSRRDRSRGGNEGGRGSRGRG